MAFAVRRARYFRNSRRDGWSQSESKRPLPHRRKGAPKGREGFPGGPCPAAGCKQTPSGPGGGGAPQPPGARREAVFLSHRAGGRPAPRPRYGLFPRESV